ncbi:hypothetical protein ACFXGT_27175 [Streptomyces sp. NPDC059352]|uniref:hypothetical protein n=1 Tax=Streptomyces sp. NPDC059352 TaxID=3346810 RepID=UPI003699FBAC
MSALSGASSHSPSWTERVVVRDGVRLSCRDRGGAGPDVHLEQPELLHDLVTGFLGPCLEVHSNS